MVTQAAYPIAYLREVSMNLRLASVLLGLFALIGCQGGGTAPLTDTSPAPVPEAEMPAAAADLQIPDKFDPVMTTPVALDDLTTMEALGVYWLE